MLDECWEWRGARNQRGYGNKNIGGKFYKTHRLAYEWANGAIPEGMQVLHRCDNPPCCNPRHLFIGTHDDNMKDMKAKGRAIGLVGERNKRAVVTDAIVREVRFGDHGRKYGLIPRLSRRYGVSKAIIARILRNESWKHVTEASSEIARGG